MGAAVTSVVRTGPATASAELLGLAATIQAKVAATQAWVTQEYGDEYHALFLDDADAWPNFPRDVQAVGGRAMAEILAATYPPDGQGYPLPEYITAESNAAAIKSGAVLPYFAFVAPRTLTRDAVYKDPRLLVRREAELQPVAVSARIPAGNDTEELGRSAKMPGYPGFRAGALVLQSYLNARRGGAQRIYADIRAASEHPTSNGKQNLVSSAATQELYYRGLGMKPTHSFPAYVVGGQLEPFVSGVWQPSDTWRKHANNFPVHTPSGAHVAFLRELTRHQIGTAAPFVVETANGAQGYTRTKAPQLHGDSVYAKLELTHAADGEDLQSALDETDALAPATLVAVPAHSPEGSATQERLMRLGFVVCGLELAHDVPDGDKLRTVPPTVFMARLGRSAASGALQVAPAYFPNDLYSATLRQQFQKIDSQLRKRRHR